MNKIFCLIIFLAIMVGCSNNKVVYWCGDHPCINKKEKEAYFKKTMIVEMKELKKENKKNNSEIEKIMQRAKLEEIERIKEEKDLTKQAKLEEKERIKEDKELAKQIKLEEKNIGKRIEKDEKMLAKKQDNTSNQSVKLNSKIGVLEIDSNEFSDLVNKIYKKNSFRPYPDINDIPN